MALQEQTLELEIGPVFVRRSVGEGEPGDLDAPPLFLHSIPTSCDDWLAALERCGGIAPDLPGFGRTSKAGHLDYTPAGHAEFVGVLLDAIGVDRVAVVGHGWGAAAGLAFAQRHPERVTRVVLLNPLPLFAGFQWGRIGRVLRSPVLRELAIGALTRRGMGRLLRSGSSSEGAWSEDEVRTIWQAFDPGTQRAVVRMFQWASPEALAAAGADLGTLSMPALVIWGERDPWLPARFADAYAARLGDAVLERRPDAGHWPWRDDPGVIERIAAFLG